MLLVAVASFGGPLALAGLYAPQSVDEVTGSAGWVGIAAVVAFAAVLAIWLRFTRDVTGPGGLAAFVEAAAGRRAALAHAAVWTGSYALYLLYTSDYVVYDLLPVAVPAVRPWRPWLAVALPLVVGVLLVAGRGALVAVVAVIAVGQVGLLVAADAVGIAHAPTAHAFSVAASGGGTAKATADVGALYICGSLPLFLGGDLRRPSAALRKALPLAFALTALLTLLALYPFARHPAYTHAAIPAMTVVDNGGSHALAVAVALGVAASVVGVMLVEGLALTRLVHAVTGRSPVYVARVLAAALVVAGPLSLIDPERFYGDLLRPSLVLLWLAQLGVVAAFAGYVVRRRLSALRWLPVTAVAAVLVGYALVTSARGGGT